MKMNLFLISILFLLLVSCDDDYKLINKGTFVSKFERDDSFVVSGPDATYLVGSTKFYIVLECDNRKDTIQYMSFKLSGDPQVGDSIWIYKSRNNRVRVANIKLDSLCNNQ